MNKYTVGGDVLSHCGKCKLALSHIIVTVHANGVPHKVQCRTCNASHNFKDPALAKVTKKKTTRAPRKKAAAIPIAQLWEEEMNKTMTKSQAYSIRSKFKKGDVIDHVKFGTGIVQACMDEKIEVLFKNDIKTLVHGK